MDGGGGDGGGGLAGLISIALTPATASFSTTNGAPASGDFKASGTFLDGRTSDITALVSWSIQDGALGGVDTKGHYTSGTTQGGTTNVSASDGVKTGTATLNLKWVGTRVSTDDGSTAPVDAATKFAGGNNDSTLAPTTVYPLDGALVPRNLGVLEVQWLKPAAAANLFEVAIVAPTYELRVYTNAVQPAGGRLALKPAEWQSLAASVLGGVAEITVRALDLAQPAQMGGSTAVKLKVGKDDVKGGLYYWAAAGTAGAVDGIYRHEFGDVTKPAQPYYTRTDGNALFNDGRNDHCVACHVISRDGTKFAVVYNGGDGEAAMYDVASKSPLVPLSKGKRWNFASMSPDGNRMVTSRQGVLAIVDTSGGPLNGDQIGASLDTGGFASHPDWSPDGTQIVYTRGTSTGGGRDWELTSSSIGVVTDTGGGFVNPTILVQSVGTENNFYPSFSPDGRWILFNRSNTNAYDDPDAHLYVVSATPGATPIKLAKADATGDLTNSWPRWSPFVQKNGENGDLFYLTFSSKRNYGIRLIQPPPGLPPRPQLWMASFDPTLATAGTDPTHAAFWLPFQNLETSNHIAQWTTQIVGIQ